MQSLQDSAESDAVVQVLQVVQLEGGLQGAQDVQEGLALGQNFVVEVHAYTQSSSVWEYLRRLVDGTF